MAKRLSDRIRVAWGDRASALGPPSDGAYPRFFVGRGCASVDEQLDLKLSSGSFAARRVLLRERSRLKKYKLATGPLLNHRHSQLALPSADWKPAESAL